MLGVSPIFVDHRFRAHSLISGLMSIALRSTKCVIDSTANCFQQNLFCNFLFAIKLKKSLFTKYITFWIQWGVVNNISNNNKICAFIAKCLSRTNSILFRSDFIICLLSFDYSCIWLALPLTQSHRQIQSNSLLIINVNIYMNFNSLKLSQMDLIWKVVN